MATVTGTINVYRYIVWVVRWVRWENLITSPKRDAVLIDTYCSKLVGTQNTRMSSIQDVN